MGIKIYDTIIIGAGPAGLSAAIYLSRAGKSVLIFEKESIGGQMAKSPKIENYPGFAAISGYELADNMFQQVCNLGVDFEFQEVVNVSASKELKCKVVYTAEENIYYASSVIVAVGMTRKELGLSNEKQLVKNGKLSYCVMCDGAFFKGEDVAVIGDANSAVQYAVELSKYCSKVSLLAWSDKLFCDEILKDRIKNIPNIEIKYNFSVKSIEENDIDKTILITSTKGDYFKTGGAFVAIGQVSNALCFNFCLMNSTGYIYADENGETNTKGIFVAGDCSFQKLHQVVGATYSGAFIAIKVVKYLEGLEK